MIVPVYNAELAPKALRGRLVSLNQLFITAGIMVIIIIIINVHVHVHSWYSMLHSWNVHNDVSFITLPNYTKYFLLQYKSMH